MSPLWVKSIPFVMFGQGKLTRLLVIDGAPLILHPCQSNESNRIELQTVA